MGQLTIQTFTYYFIYSGARKLFHKITQHMFFKACFPIWFNMR